MRRLCCVRIVLGLIPMVLLHCSVEATAISVDVGQASGDISGTVFGHNISHSLNARGLWNDATKAPVVSAKDVIQEAGCGAGAPFRFAPTGSYHWRRGVGSSRPANLSNTDNNFGTDEYMKFLRDVLPNAEPLMIVNCWAWKEWADEQYRDDGKAKLAREATNWVEYCNGNVDDEVTRECLVHPNDPDETHTVLEWAAHEGWAPSKWAEAGYDELDPPLTEDFGTTAIEWGGTYNDGVAIRRSWRSYEQAPDGYFAWLRYYFAQQRNQSDSGPYGIKYWEIGNESWKYAEKCEAAGIEDYDDILTDFATAMQAKDSTVEIGANMHDIANLRYYDSGAWYNTTAPGTGNLWDTTIGDNANVDFLTVHPYDTCQSADRRYSAYNAPTTVPTTGIHAS